MVRSAPRPPDVHPPQCLRIRNGEQHLERAYIVYRTNAMLTGAISKSSKQKKQLDQPPADSTKRRIRKKLNSVATVMGKIEDIVSTGDEKTDSTPLTETEVNELERLAKRLEEEVECLYRDMRLQRTEMLIDRLERQGL